MDKKGGKSPVYEHLEESFQKSVISGTECTGMVAAPPLDQEQAESYRQIYDIPLEQNEDMVERE